MEQKMISDLARKERFDKEADVREQLPYLINDFLTKEHLAKKVIG